MNLDLDWIEPENGNFAGYYYGNNEVRISDGKRTFLLKLEGQSEKVNYNLAVVYRSGEWIITSKIAADRFRVVEAIEIIETWVKVFPLGDELEVKFKTNW